MRKKMHRTRAQSLSEYGFSLAIVLIAVIAMNVYVKRGLQGRYRDVMDATISAVSAKAGKAVAKQYEPYYTTSEKTIDLPRSHRVIINSQAHIARVLSGNSQAVVTSKDREGVNPD